MEEGERERLERERIQGTKQMEETEETTEKRPHTGTDVEFIQSRQRKGQMKSIFLSNSDEEAIVKFVKQHKELYDKTHAKFKDKQRKECLWERLAPTMNLSVSTVKKWLETQCTSRGRSCF